MSELDKKSIINDTSESFCPLRPIQFNQHNHQAPSQIQQMLGLLAQKRSKLRDLKWEGNSLKGKYQQQDRRITEIRCTMDFHIEKEEVQVNNAQKYKELQTFMEDDIKKLENDVDSLKDELTSYYEAIMSTKKEKDSLVREHGNLECRLKELEGAIVKIESESVLKDNQIVSLQAAFRASHSQVTKQQIEFTDLESLSVSYGKKNIIGRKQLHSQHCKNREFRTQIQTTEDRITNLKKDSQETTWQFEKIEVHNSQIREVNDRLEKDLNAVQKHFASIKKTNQILTKCLSEYSQTAQKVAKLVIMEEPSQFV